MFHITELDSLGKARTQGSECSTEGFQERAGAHILPGTMPFSTKMQNKAHYVFKSDVVQGHLTQKDAHDITDKGEAGYMCIVLT